MSVQDLTNTKWVFNTTINVNSGFTASTSYSETPIFPYSLIFIDGNDEQHTALGCASSNGIRWNIFVYQGDIYNRQAYMGGWVDEAYRTIEITGGTDVTNATLIAWLQASAVQVPVVDLTDTTWVFNDTIMATNNGGGWDINFVSNNVTYEHMTAYYWYNSRFGDGENYLQYDSTYVATGPVSPPQEPINSWTDNAYKTIEITGGTDVSNLDLISWLAQNATYQAPHVTKLVNSNDLNTALDAIADAIRERGNTSAALTFNIPEGGDFVTAISALPIDVPLPQLNAPAISLDGSVLYITDAVSNGAFTTKYDIYVDAVSKIQINKAASFDLAALALEPGTYSITVKCTNPNFITSAASVAVSYEAVLIMPSKGDLITMNVDGSGKQFRVLNVNGSNAEVVMMSNASDSQQFAASGRIYAGSALDTYLNSTWYNTLNATAQAAIVDKTFTQDSWYWDASGNPDYSGYYGQTNPGTSAYTISLGNAAFGSSITRHVYALSVQDVLDYVLDTSITDGSLQNYNIWKMFWDITTQPPSTPQRSSWLRSASASSSYNVFFVTGVDGSVRSSDASTLGAVRPAFTIDLTKITWSEVNL